MKHLPRRAVVCDNFCIALQQARVLEGVELGK